MAKPRLLSLNSYHYRRGGSDAVYFEQDQMFREQGWDTGFFSMHHPSNDPSEWSKYFIDELEFGGDYGLLDKLSMAGKVIYSLEAKKKMNQLIDDWRPDIAHAHCIYHHLSPSALAALKDRGVPTVMTAHDLKLACPAYKMLNSNGICEKCKGGNLLHVVKNRCLHGSLAVSTLVMVESAVHKMFGMYKNNLDKIVAPSRFFEKKLIEWGWPQEKLVYIPNNIDTSHYEPQHQVGDYLFYFGRLAPEKGVATLLKAASQAGVKLHLAGTGPIEAELKQLASELGCDATFHGFCKKDEFLPMLNNARAVVLPSEWYENAPMSVLEAYALGKIVIGADIGGIPEMIEEGETGYLFESGNQQALSEAIETVFSKTDDQLVSMGRTAREYVATKFTAQKYYESMAALYTELGAGSEAIADKQVTSAAIY
ncbi:MAG: glycosyltransferase family 4 protein [Gammaproteobacteria bacterium]